MGAQPPVMDSPSAALLAHVVAQIENNVSFLADNAYISHSDAATILSRLPNRAADVAPPPIRMPVVTAPPPPPVHMPPPPTPSQSRYKALWAYNENGADPNDLSFSAGDVIEVVEETNADWWTGRVNGREGLFPSTYVEKIQGPVVMPKSTKPYKAFGAAYHGVATPTPSAQPAGLHQDEAGQQEKKDKFAPYKSTLAHSAVGGVGFGAGSAIGGGLVRAIF